jgi:hypothetical protein
MASLMKDDVNDEVPSGIPKLLIPFDGVVNWDGMLNQGIGYKVTMLHIYWVG